MSSSDALGSFAQMNLPAPLQQALAEVGYETPSAIQARTIPHMLAGADVLGQAQTGTGKTAAFALPLLARLDLAQTKPQALVLAPTRELAIQVAEAFQKYARHLKGFRVLPIYGGSDLRSQIRQLQRGVHVVVATPGRVMDHMRRKSLDLSNLQTLVLDEADEMLRMGFIDDVRWILEQIPEDRQTALFSATMPDAIRRIARQHLRSPQEISIEVKTITNEAIHQRVWMMAGVHKMDALTRILEVEDFDAVLIFVRTRIATTEVADKLAARGYAVAALNGDIPQAQREKTVARLKKSQIDILVATDVAARGLDVSRISHVVNYDIPYDVEAYVHRIGRTGRAGRKGEAILFVSNRERRLLRAIEKATGNTIDKMQLPTAQEVKDKRIDRFKQRITETLDTADLDVFRALVADYQHEYGVPVMDIAAALVSLAQEGKSGPVALGSAVDDRGPGGTRRGGKKRPERQGEGREKSGSRAKAVHRGAGAKEEGEDVPRRRDDPVDGTRRAAKPATTDADVGMERFRIEVGSSHGVKPANIVGAIANEAELDSEYIGRIDIQEEYSTVELPEGMPKELFKHLKSVWVSGQRLQISRADTAPKGSARKGRAPRGKSAGKPRSGK